MATSKPEYRTIKVRDVMFQYRVKEMETEFLFTDGSICIFSNWDIKGYRERFYTDECLNVPTEFLHMQQKSGEIVERGIDASDIQKFILRKSEFFEDLLLNITGKTPLDSEENL